MSKRGEKILAQCSPTPPQRLGEGDHFTWLAIRAWDGIKDGGRGGPEADLIEDLIDAEKDLSQEGRDAIALLLQRMFDMRRNGSPPGARTDDKAARDVAVWFFREARDRFQKESGEKRLNPSQRVLLDGLTVEHVNRRFARQLAPLKPGVLIAKRGGKSAPCDDEPSKSTEATIRDDLWHDAPGIVDALVAALRDDRAKNSSGRKRRVKQGA